MITRRRARWIAVLLALLAVLATSAASAAGRAGDPPTGTSVPAFDHDLPTGSITLSG